MSGEGSESDGAVLDEVGTLVGACNALTVRWVGTVDDAGFVVSGPCVWPLLAALAAGADGPARDELEHATGVPAIDGVTMAARMLGMLERIPQMRAAIGIWIRDGIVLDPAWVGPLPVESIGRLSGRSSEDAGAIGAWIRERTGGLIDVAVSIDGAVETLLVSAITIRTEWTEPFAEGIDRPTSGPWRGRKLDALFLTSRDLDRVAVAETGVGPVTMFAVPGVAEVDVHLVIAEPDVRISDAVAQAVSVLGGALPVRRGSELAMGDRAPGLEVRAMMSTRDDPPSIRVRTVRFDVTRELDLRRHADVLGLRAALDGSVDRFPGISATPLVFDDVVHAARAAFRPRGFLGAAFTTLGAILASNPPPADHEVHVIDLRIDRPFGFVVVHRPTGLVLMAGGVDEAQRYSA